MIEPNRSRYVERDRFEQPDCGGQPAWSHPIIANGKMYLRDQDILFCYDVNCRAGRDRSSNQVSAKPGAVSLVRGELAKHYLK